MIKTTLFCQQRFDHFCPVMLIRSTEGANFEYFKKIKQCTTRLSKKFPELCQISSK